MKKLWEYHTWCEQRKSMELCINCSNRDNCDKGIKLMKDIEEENEKQTNLYKKQIDNITNEIKGKAIESLNFNSGVCRISLSDDTEICIAYTDCFGLEVYHFLDKKENQ